MSVMDMWSVCDRCGFNYKRRQLRKETTNFVVCSSCYDGRYDLKNHPQNYSPRPRRESIPVPDGRAQQDLTVFLTTEAGGFLLIETGDEIIVTPVMWNPSMSSPP
jgi:hypothetical protein